MLTATHNKEIKKLVRAIKRARGGFALFFVECNTHALRHEVADLATASLSTQPILLDVAELADDAIVPLDVWINDHIKDSPSEAAIFLFGLFHLLPVSNQEKLRQQMQQINWRRSAFSRLNRPLIIWLPSYAMRLLAENTPDFYDWYSGSYIFHLIDKDRERLFGEFTQSLRTDSGVPAADAMSKSEKRKRLQLILELLQEHKQRDKAKAQLLLERGYIEKNQGQYDAALENHTEALAIWREIGDKLGEGTTLNNMSAIALARGDTDTALIYLTQSLQIQQEIGDRSSEGATLNNISQIYKARGDYDTALTYLTQSLQIRQEIGGERMGSGFCYFVYC